MLTLRQALRSSQWRSGLSSLLMVLGIAIGATSSVAPARAAESDALRRTSPTKLASLPPSARAAAVFESDVPQLVATLLVTTGSPARIGVLFELAPGWHLYWRNPGETGVAPEIELEATGYQVGSLEWPAPETFREADDLFTTYGYEGHVLLAADLTPSSDGGSEASPATRVARAEASVLICRTQCVPATISLESPLEPMIDAADQIAMRALFRESEAQIPLPAAALGWSLSAAWSAGVSPAVDATSRLELALDPCGGKTEDCGAGSARPSRVSFLPFESETFEFAREQRISSDSKSSRIALGLELTRLEPGEDRLRGVVELHDTEGATRRVEIDVPVQGISTSAAGMLGSLAAFDSDSDSGAASAAVVAERGSELSTTPIAWLQVFCLALLGGLILNGMPCVLPVLAIKVVSVADMAERDPREVRMHGLAYTAGVLGSMFALASLVLSLRFAGHAVGWGFQFQEPLFVAGIAALLVTFALNLFGVFEIELGQGRLAAVGQDATGYSRSVFEGLLAVVLATPCTAPFLGTAVGFAFASSGYGILAIFLAIGVGLASPFLLVSFFPRLARFIPRSGPWMLKLRAGLGFCLLATVVWLLWIVGQSGGSDAVVAMMAALLFLAFLLWSYGQMQPMRSLWLGRASAVGIASLALASFNLIDFQPAASASMSAGAQPDLESDGFAPYSEAAVQEALSRGVPAFVVFTADWCITCKVNEKTVLDRPAVREALERRGFALFKADWTRRDDTIRKKLAAFGRAGVPLYLVYDPATPDRPQVLSELLTQDAVVAALAEGRSAGAI